LLAVIAILFVTGGVSVSGQGIDVQEPALFRTEIRLEAPAASVASLPRVPAEWYLTPAGAAALGSGGDAAGISAATVAELRRRASGDGIGGLRIVPDVAFLDSLRPGERAALTTLLVADARNVVERWPVSVRPGALAELELTPSLGEAASRVRRWSTEVQGRLVFRDLFALEDAFASSDDRVRFLQKLTGADALLVKLEVPESSAERGRVAAYWHSHGHYRTVRPFLTALSAIEGHDRVDLAHLLPTQPRFLINTFPTVLARSADPSADSAGMAARFYSAAAAVNGDLSRGFRIWLAEECVPLAGAPQFGDLLLFEDPTTNEWPYTAVYVADGIVFGRSPTAFGAWRLMTLAEISQLNPRLAGTPRMYRTRTFAGPAALDPVADLGRSPSVFVDGLELRAAAPGPWGRLYSYQVLLAPSGDLLSQIPEPSAEPEWRFAGVTRAELLDGVRAMPMSAATRGALLELFDRATPGADGTITVRPTSDLVFDTPRAFRDRFFPYMAFPQDGLGYLSNLTVPTTESAEEWFSEDLIPAEVREAFLRLPYRRRGGIGMADFGAAYHLSEDPTDRLAVLQGLFRTPGVVALLARPLPQDVPALAAYWDPKGERNLRPLLESFARNPDVRFIDVIQLLPQLPRQLMNLFYNGLTGQPAPNCTWTSLNFNALFPNNRFLLMPGRDREQAMEAWQELTARYEGVPEARQLGDILVYRPRNEPERILHMCALVADDIVFTKNGYGPTEPWSLQRRSDMEALYLTNEVEVAYFRARR
jgi:hypothetical protein